MTCAELGTMEIFPTFRHSQPTSMALAKTVVSTRKLPDRTFDNSGNVLPCNMLATNHTWLLSTERRMSCNFCLILINFH